MWIDTVKTASSQGVPELNVIKKLKNSISRARFLVKIRPTFGYGG